MKEYKININGNTYNVAVDEDTPGILEVEVNGTPYKVEVESKLKPLMVKPITKPVQTHETVAKPAPSHDVTAIVSPLPGAILDICVKVGDEVKVGQKVAVLEAMKMENDINADKAGKVASIKVSKGDTVLEGAVIMTIG